MKKIKIISTTFIVFLLIALTVISVSALDWEGSTAGGGSVLFLRLTAKNCTQRKSII